MLFSSRRAIILIITIFFVERSTAQSFEAIELDHLHRDKMRMGGGVAFIDFNRDGFDDIYLTGGIIDDKLFENQGNGSFKDVTSNVLPDLLRVVQTNGVTVGDINNDGFDDLFVTTVQKQSNILLLNKSGESFQDISSASGIEPEKDWSTTATMSDYDQDGYLDIYVANYVAFDKLPLLGNITETEQNYLYHNNGDNTFTRVDQQVGLIENGCTLASLFSDFDQDGDQDVLVLNDFGDIYEPNKLFVNTNGIFEEIGTSSNFYQKMHSMGIASADYDEDGDFDYYVSNWYHNVLLEKGEGNTYEEVAELKGVRSTDEISWGIGFLDYNNDAHIDLYVVNGHVYASGASTTSQINRLYKGTGDGNFEEVTEKQQVGDPTSGRGMAYADYDNDGLLDVLVGQITGGTVSATNTLLYHNKNHSDNNWVRVKLQGTTNNRNGFGSIIKVFAGEKSWVREINGGGSYLSSHGMGAHFGLGGYSSIDSLIVNWPGQKKETYTNIPVNETITVIEGKEVLISISQVLTVNPGEEVFLEGATRNEVGIYYDTVPTANPEMLKKVVTTRLEINRKDLVVTFLENSEKMELALFPNPVSDHVVIKGNDIFGKFNLTLTNATGKKVLSTSKESSQGKIVLDGLDSLEKGIYILTLQNRWKLERLKIIKG